MCILLLRGLFAAGVLEFVFAKKRWRVNYGLDLSRSKLAVPYHAKDNVSPNLHDRDCLGRTHSLICQINSLAPGPSSAILIQQLH